MKYNIKEFLEDIGLNKNKINELTNLYNNKEYKKLESELNIYRKEILNIIHCNEKKINIIDYFIYNIEEE